MGQNTVTRAWHYSLLGLLLGFLLGTAEAAQNCWDNSAVLSFPGAEGWGACAIGGRGGAVIKVTSLANSGAGTLRACLEASGPRTCVFDISGTIAINNATDEILITNGNVTIAGNTAPGDGIQIRNGRFNIQASNVIIRHIRIRPGLVLNGSIVVSRAIQVLAPTGGSVSDVIIDHGSFGWAQDDQFGIGSGSGPVVDVTLSYSIFHEALETDDFGKGGVVSGFNGPNRVSFLHSLFAHNADRPTLSAGHVQVVNTVAYHTRGGAFMVFPSSNGVTASYIQNYFKSGPSGPNGGMIRTFGATHAAVGPVRAAASSMYLLDNIDPTRCPTLPCNQETAHVRHNNGGITVTGTAPSHPTIPSATTAALALTRVLAHVGATVPVRDHVDWRVTQDVLQGDGITTLADPATVGGYPTPATVTRPANYDTDGDGMPDQAETLCGLNKHSAADRNDDADGDGWTNLEEIIWPEGNLRHAGLHGAVGKPVYGCNARLKKVM